MTTIDSEGRPQEWRAHYWQHHCEIVVGGFASADDAKAFLNNGEDEGSMSSCCVIWPEGRARRYDYVHNEFADWLEPHGEVTGVPAVSGGG